MICVVLHTYVCEQMKQTFLLETTASRNSVRSLKWRMQSHVHHRKENRIEKKRQAIYRIQRCETALLCCPPSTWMMSPTVMLLQYQTKIQQNLSLCSQWMVTWNNTLALCGFPSLQLPCTIAHSPSSSFPFTSLFFSGVKCYHYVLSLNAISLIIKRW